MAGKSELTLEQQLEELKNQLAKQAEQNQALTATLQEKDAALAEKDQTLSEKESIIDEQLQALEDAEASKGKVLPVVTVDGKQYQVASAKFQHPGKDAVVTAEELVADKELLAALIEMKSGILVPIVK